MLSMHIAFELYVLNLYGYTLNSSPSLIQIFTLLISLVKFQVKTVYHAIKKQKVHCVLMIEQMQQVGLLFIPGACDLIVLVLSFQYYLLQIYYFQSSPLFTIKRKYM